MQFDRIDHDGTGTFKRGSVTLALVGQMKCNIHWAANALAIHLPVNAARGLYTYPHPNLDVARNLAISDWVKRLREMDIHGRTGVLNHFFVWPVDQYITWDAIVRACEADKPVAQIGEAFCFNADGVDRDKKCWFKAGKWIGGTEPTKMDRLIGHPDQYMKLGEPPDQPQGPRSDVDAITSEQIFVTALPSLGYTSLVWLAHALQLAAPVACVKLLTLMTGREVADARNRIVESVLKVRPRPELIFWYGDDNVPPANGMQLLWETMHKRNASAVAGIYNMRYRPPLQPLLWRHGKAGWMIPGRDFQMGDVVECDGTGMDFVLMKTDIFEKIPKPWFKTGLEYVEGKGICVFTEDAHFWQAYRKCIGEMVLADTRARIGHYDINDGSMY